MLNEQQLEDLCISWFQETGWRFAHGPDIAPDMALHLLDGQDNPVQSLTPREFEVLRLLLEGRSAEQIGATLHISPKTAQNCHYQIKAKLGVRSDIELVKLAMKLRLVDG